MKRIIIEKWRLSNPAEVARMLQEAWFDHYEQINHKIKEDHVEFTQSSPYRCAYCGKQGADVVIHHIYGRRYRSLKENPYNLIPLCAEHHTNSRDFSAHLTPAKFRSWFKRTYPERYTRLTSAVLAIRGQR